jgi:toxin-antitoxin system PIN domain toxin
MRFLLDVNVLVAWGWADHTEHVQVTEWLATIVKNRSNTLLTSAIPELGFVRVSVQRSQGKVTAALAGEVLDGMLRKWRGKHEFLADDQPARVWPTWCQSATRTTDAHLLALAKAHQAELATLDAGIPGGFLIPRR